jgi:hypothetical protein
MEKKKKRSTTPRSVSFNAKGLKDSGMVVLTTLFGIYAGNQLGKLLKRNVTPAVKGILGLDGSDSKLVAPIVLAGGGLIASQLVKNSHLKNVCYGIAGSGGIMLAKDVLKVDMTSSLSGDDDMPHIQGLASPNLPVLTDDPADVKGVGSDDEERIAGTVGAYDEPPIAGTLEANDDELLGYPELLQ